MRSLFLVAVAVLAIGGCSGGDLVSNEVPADGDKAPAGPASAPAVENRTVPASRWHLQSGGEGATLALMSSNGASIRLSCPAGRTRLLVNVPGFRPIGREERLSIGRGGNVTALVADPRGDAERGGVSATGAVPADLAALLGGPVSASYGAQTSGPHAVPPPNLTRAFLAACGVTPAAAGTPIGPAHACLVQGSERLRMAPLRAIGTEPFWGARIEGRCVTYSHPEDQDGTRVWTRYTARPDGGTWTGALGGKPFELRTRAAPGCSDGMSDRRYPIAVELTVGGERRTGCAEPV